MHTKTGCIAISLTFACWILPAHGSAQDIIGIIASGVTRVIRAVDLKIQRLQTRTIVLEEAQKLVENALSALSLDEIRSWVQAQKDLYDEYFQELWTVKSLIAGYSRVETILRRQEQIVQRYAQIRSFLSGNPRLTPTEIETLTKTVAGILTQSSANLSQLTRIVQSFNYQMSDQQRATIIDAVARDTDRLGRAMDQAGNQAALLQLQRASEYGEIELIKKIYGL